MKKIAVKDLVGGEILAKDLFTSSFTVLMARGTVLKKEYIERFPLLGIEYVYIEEIGAKKKKGKKAKIIQKQVKEECSEKVKNVLEKHIYKHNSELASLCSVAETLIEDILDEKEVYEEIVEIRAQGGDMYTHSVNVCALSSMLALKLGVEKEVAKDIARGSILHDIGLRYITVDYENIDISSQPLFEQKEFQKHTIYGFNALKEEEWLSEEAKNIILFHHEYENGSGYPLHLTGNKLSLSVKIVSICNAFDQMISGIGYRQTNLQEAIEFLRDNTRVLFDKEITGKFLQMIVQYPNGTIVQTNEGEIGKVIKQNLEMADRPVLEIFKDENGLRIEPKKKINLIENLNIFITKVIE